MPKSHAVIASSVTVADRSSKLFARAFGHGPAASARAPGRVNLIGEHIDYSGGFVLPIAIERDTVASGELTASGLLEVVSEARPGELVQASLAMLTPGSVKGWAAYVAGVVAQYLPQLEACAAMRQDGAEGKPLGVRIAIASDVPVGAGLSSSAAIEVSTAMCLHALGRFTPAPVEVVKACRRAEHDYAGVPCGIMDQYISAMGVAGHALLIDCFAQTHRAIPISDEVAIVIADTGVKHSLADGEYAQRRGACERALAAIVRIVGPRQSLRHCSLEDLARAEMDLEPIDMRRARHAITECARSLSAAECLAKREFAAAGDCMKQSHASLRDDYEVSCIELDLLADAISAMPGVFGARMTGGGFGGCVVALVRATEAANVCERVIREGKSRLVFATKAAPGAQ